MTDQQTVHKTDSKLYTCTICMPIILIYHTRTTLIVGAIAQPKNKMI